jgi:hypothetical protein
VGLLKKVWAKLFGDPNTAAQQPAIALVEVRRTLGSLRETVLEISYLGVPGQDLADVRKALDRLESGQLFEEVIRAKGSCHKIGHIYDRHLQAWFKSLLDRGTQDQLQTLFNELRNSDGWAVDAMERVVNDAKPVAQKIRVLFDEKKEAEAHATVRAFSQGFRPQLEKLSEAMSFMLSLEAEFIRKGRLT